VCSADSAISRSRYSHTTDADVAAAADLGKLLETCSTSSKFVISSMLMTLSCSFH